MLLLNDKQLTKYDLLVPNSLNIRRKQLQAVPVEIVFAFN